MTIEEIEILKKEFKKIVYYRGLIKSQNNFIGTLSRFDKNGSHKQAILNAIERKNELLSVFNRMLKDRSYEEWKELMKKISKLKTQLDKAILQKGKILYEIEKLKL